MKTTIPDQISHGQNLGVVLERLCLLAVERIDVGFHEHVSQDEILQAGGAAGGAALVVVLEGFEEVGVGLFKLSFA